MRASVIGLLAVALLCGCSSWETQTSKTHLGDEQVVVTTADQRVIVARAARDGQWVDCAEPSPDTAKALETALDLSASGSAPSGPQGQLAMKESTKETITQLAGRTAGVVALRDGAFRTCEFYGNGAIGKTGVALGLSRYGDLLAALMLAEAAASSGGSGNGSNSPAAINDIAADYFDPTRIYGSLLVACEATHDNTNRAAPVAGTPGAPNGVSDNGDNDFLTTQNCMKYEEKFGALLAAKMEADKEVKLAQLGKGGKQSPPQSHSSHHQELIKSVQAALAAAKLYMGPVDGRFGKQTKAALIKFQKEKKIEPASGQIDDKTKQELGISS